MSNMWLKFDKLSMSPFLGRTTCFAQTKIKCVKKTKTSDAVNNRGLGLLFVDDS